MELTPFLGQTCKHQQQVKQGVTARYACTQPAIGKVVGDLGKPLNFTDGKHICSRCAYRVKPGEELA